MKRSCNPGNLQSNANHDAYIIKAKNMVTSKGTNHYALFTDRLMTKLEAQNECLAVGRHVVALESESEFNDFKVLIQVYAILTTPIWTSLDLSYKAWQLDVIDGSNHSTAALSWTLPWSKTHPILNMRYGLLNQTSSEFISDDGTMKAYVVCEGYGPFKVYGSQEIDVDGEDGMTLLTNINNGFVDCMTVSDRNPVGAEYTFELPTFTPDANTLLVRISGSKPFGENKQHFSLMFAKSLTYTSDGRNIQEAYYGHCQWITEFSWDNLEEGKMFSTLQFHCECGHQCSKLYLKFFKDVLICDISIP